MIGYFLASAMSFGFFASLFLRPTAPKMAPVETLDHYHELRR